MARGQKWREGGAAQPEIVWTRAARVRIGMEPEPGEPRVVELRGLVADLQDIARHWTGYPVDSARREELFGQARELRRRIARASPETVAGARARAETLRASGEPALRCVLDFVFTGERAWSRADAEHCLARPVTPACAELLLGSLDDPDLARRIVEGRLRADRRRGVSLRALELVHGLGARALPVLEALFGVLEADRRRERASRQSRYRPIIGDAEEHTWVSAGVPRVLEAIEAIRTPEAAAFFAAHLGSADLRTIAGRYFRAEPGLAMRVLPAVAARRTKAGSLARALLEVVSAEHPDLAGAPARRRSSHPPRPACRDAGAAEIPPVLADPPWRRDGGRDAPHLAVAIRDEPIPSESAPDAWVERLPHVPAFLVFSPRIACAMATSWLHSPGRRKVAEDWLVAFPEIAAAGLLPRALGSDWSERLDALRVLRFLLSRDEEAVRRGVARYSPEAQATLDAALAHDPFDACPSAPPGPPRFLRIDALPRPLLAGRAAALPREAVRNLVEMLIFAVDGFPYAGVDQVRAACDQASLDAFVWAIYEAWLAVGAPTRVRWPMRALGELGGDEIARRLAPLVRAWPAQRATARAVAGVRALGRIGSDVALTHLGSIAELSRSRPLKAEARAVLREVARARGLGPWELGDRTVPELDLGPDDGKGAPWEALRGDAQTLVAAQIQRLERIMTTQRTWDVPTFRAAVLGHRLISRLVRGLLLVAWGEAGGEGFRVTEDGTLAGLDDAPFSLDRHTRVGIPHPIDMVPAGITAWSNTFADYEILQPFPQLGREIFTLSDAERAATSLRRIEGVRVATRRLLDLEGLGWERAGYDKRSIDVLWKPLPGGRYVRFDVRPGVSLLHPRTEPEQTLGPLLLLHRDEPAPFGDLSPLVASELLRELNEALA